MIPWRPHDGGKCPLDAEAMVRPRIRALDRTTAERREFTKAKGWRWPHSGGPGDIMEMQVRG